MKLFLLLAVFAWLIVKYWGFFIFFSICVIIFYLKCFGHLIKVKTTKKSLLALKLWSEKQKEELMLKYGDEEIVSNILKQNIWIGETSSQLRDSLGEPVDISEWRNAKESGETWKYHKTGKNRYALKIYLTDDQVSGWDKK